MRPPEGFKCCGDDLPQLPTHEGYTEQGAPPTSMEAPKPDEAFPPADAAESSLQQPAKNWLQDDC